MKVRTVAGRSVAELEVKRSKFLAVVDRADSETRVREVLAQARSADSGAGHHCSAFVIGDGQRIERTDDDGEPGGTAGMPMLEVLRGHGLTNTVAVVSRYFGGTKLGTGGLARAYSGAVALALKSSTYLDRERRNLLTAELDHVEVGRVEAELRARGVVVVSVDYGATAQLTVAVSDIDSARELFASITAGRTMPVPAGHVWVEHPASR